MNPNDDKQSDTPGVSGNNVEPDCFAEYIAYSAQPFESTPIDSEGSRFQRFFADSGIESPQSQPQPFPQYSYDLLSDNFANLSFSGSDLTGTESNRNYPLTTESSGVDWAQDILGQGSIFTEQSLRTEPSFSTGLRQQSTSNQSWEQTPSYQLPLATYQSPSEHYELPSNTQYLEDWKPNIFTSNLTAQEQRHEELNTQTLGGTHSFTESENITEDIEMMTLFGFIIDLPNTSAQSVSGIIKGWYALDILYQKDIRNQSFTNSDVGQSFVVKFIEFDEKDSMSDTKREMFETEKFILTFGEHPNIVSIKYIFNMGPHKQCKYRHNPNVTFSSPQRIFIILEFADLGDLENYLEDNILTEKQLISFVRQLYSGLKHLHDSNIFHGDIEPRNILLFSNNSDIVVKWCDFSIGSILDGSHPSQPSNSCNAIERINVCRRYDIECLSKIFYQILMFSTPSGQTTQNIQQIIDILSDSNDLNESKPMIDALSTT